MKAEAITKDKTTSSPTVHDIDQPSSALHKVGMYITGAFAVMVGIWGVICLSSAMISTGGPIALVKSMFSAMSGSM